MKAIDNFILEAHNEFGGGATITEDQVRSIVKKVGRSGFGLGHIKQPKIFQDGIFKVPNGPFDFDTRVTTDKTVSIPQQSVVSEPDVQTTVNLVATNMEKQNLVPSSFEGFVPWGHH